MSTEGGEMDSQLIAGAESARSAETVHVLCVDDDELTLELTVEMLERRGPEMNVTGLSDPTEAVSYLGREPVDCLVSDYDMPEMDGLALLEQVREEFSGLPFILFTGKGSEQVASDAISAGVTDYLRKGSGEERYDMLCNRIENAVERRREHRRRVRAEQWYYQLFEQRLIGVGLSQNQVYREANGLFADMLGYDREELIGMSVLETVASYDHDRVRHALDRREEKTADRVRYTVDIHCRDGSNRTVEVIGSRVSYQGEPAILGLILPADGAVARDGPQLDSALQQLDSVRERLEQYDDEQITEAYALTTQVRESLSALSVGHRSEQQPRASVESAVHEAWSRLDTPDSAQLEIVDETTVRAQHETLTALVEQILSAVFDDISEECTVQCRATDGGFALRAISPVLDVGEDGPLVSDRRLPPDPITEVHWQRGIDIYINRISEQAVEYEVLVSAPF